MNTDFGTVDLFSDSPADQVLPLNETAIQPAISGNGLSPAKIWVMGGREGCLAPCKIQTDSISCERLGDLRWLCFGR